MENVYIDVFHNGNVQWRITHMVWYHRWTSCLRPHVKNILYVDEHRRARLQRCDSDYV